MLSAELIGRLGANAKIVTPGNNRPFVSLSIAHTESYTDKNGNRCEITTWINAIINWNAERLMPYLLKGTQVYVRGKVRLRAFLDNDQKPKASMDIIVDSLELCAKPTTATVIDNSDVPF